jgi:hypothetical protein
MGNDDTLVLTKRPFDMDGANMGGSPVVDEFRYGKRPRPQDRCSVCSPTRVEIMIVPVSSLLIVHDTWRMSLWLALSVFGAQFPAQVWIIGHHYIVGGSSATSTHAIWRACWLSAPHDDAHATTATTTAATHGYELGKISRWGCGWRPIHARLQPHVQYADDEPFTRSWYESQNQFACRLLLESLIALTIDDCSSVLFDASRCGYLWKQRQCLYLHLAFPAPNKVHGVFCCCCFFLTPSLLSVHILDWRR